nr:hypothetical protein [Tanacetum cinerariifolium]
MSTPTFAKTHNLIIYWDKPTKSEQFAQIIDFLNGSSVKYALTVSPTIHTSCIKQFWTSAKVKTVNDEVRIQALADGKRVNIKESSIRRILRLEDAEGTSCLINANIFKGLARMGAKTTSWNEFSSTMTYAIICLATNQKFNFSRYILLSLVKNIDAGVPFFMFPRVGTGFYKVVTLLFDNMLVQTPKKIGILQADAQPIPIPTEPSNFKPQKKHKPKRKHTQEPKVPPTKSPIEHNLPSPSHDPLRSGEDSQKLKELMDFYTNLSNKVLDLESEVIDIKSTYQVRIKKLKSRVEKLEEENKVLNELKSVHSIVDSDEPVMEKKKSSKQGRKIANIDADVEINLEKAQAESYNLDLDHQEKVLSMLDVNDEEPGDVEEVLKVVKAAKLITEVVTTAGVDHYKYNQSFLNEVNEGIKVQEQEVRQEKEVEVERSKREGESLKQEIAKKQKMKQETEELKKHLQIVPDDDDDDDVYTDATPLASKILIIDYKIYTERNRPYFKIIRAAGNHKLFLSFSTMLKNFNREDLKSLWNIVRKRFAKTEPKNYSGDFLLNTLKIKFEKPNVEANVWNDQKGKYGLAEIFLLIERMYTLTHFTLEQMVNDVRLEVEDENEMSLELLRLVRR